MNHVKLENVVLGVPRQLVDPCDHPSKPLPDGASHVPQAGSSAVKTRLLELLRLSPLELE